MHSVMLYPTRCVINRVCLVYCVFDLAKIYYVEKSFSVQKSLRWSEGICKGNLQPKGGLLTLSLVEDRTVLLFFSVGDLPHFLRSLPHFLTFGTIFRQTETFYPKFRECYYIKNRILFVVAFPNLD